MQRVEMETIVFFNETQAPAEISTQNGKLQRRLKELSEERPDECRLIAENEFEGMRFSFPKDWLRINPGHSRDLSDEQREQIKARLHGA